MFAFFFLNKILRHFKVILVHLPDSKTGCIPKGHNKVMWDDHHEEAKCSSEAIKDENW